METESVVNGEVVTTGNESVFVVTAAALSSSGATLTKDSHGVTPTLLLTSQFLVQTSSQVTIWPSPDVAVIDADNVLLIGYAVDPSDIMDFYLR